MLFRFRFSEECTHKSACNNPLQLASVLQCERSIELLAEDLEPDDL